MFLCKNRENYPSVIPVTPPYLVSTGYRKHNQAAQKRRPNILIQKAKAGL